MHYLDDIRRFIDILTRSERFHMLIVIGAAGWAKTSTTRKALADLGLGYQVLGSYATTLALYNALHAARDEILVIDDTAIFQNVQALTLLNSACWPGVGEEKKRTVTWASTGSGAVCPIFDFSGKIILLSNFMVESHPAKALVNRSLMYKIELSEELIGQLLTEAARSSEFAANTSIATEVAEFLKDSAKSRDITKMSLRTLELGIELALLDPLGWRDLLIKTLPAGRPEDLVAKLASSSLSTEEQWREFHRLTGKSRRTFFYTRLRLRCNTDGPVV